MSDARVQRAIEDSISKHEEEIGRQICLQYVIVETLLQAGTSPHALWSMTNRYKEMDRQIGEHRNSIRNLKAQM